MAKPILTLKRKKPIPEPIVEIKAEEIPVNPIASIELNVWDYPPYSDFAEDLPRQRIRRKDKYVEQYRKEARWQ
jgi:hypothetical protein